MLEIFSQISSPVQEHVCRGAPRAPANTNYYANKRESSFWMILCDIMLPISPLVFIRGRTWNRKTFLQFKNNTLPKLFLFLFPRPFNFFTMHQGSQQGRVGMRILLETPPVNPSPSDYPPYFYRRNICE